MFGSDYVFTDYPTTREEMKVLLESYDFSEEQIEVYMTGVDATSGAYCVNLTRERALQVATINAPHHMKRMVPPIGYSVVVMNLADLTPDEELAVAAHEFGHACCGHEPNEENALQCELEADRYACVGVGANHMYNALVKVRDVFELHESSMIEARLEAMRSYL